MSKYWADLVHNLAPYVPGEQPQDQVYIKLNTNENPYPPSPDVSAALHTYSSADLRRYPDPESTKLRGKLADYHNLQPEQIFLGNGSDEVLAHSFQAFFKKQDAILYPDISYSFYPVYCSLYEIRFKCIALDKNFCIDPADYKQANGGIIIPNPNAPTGIAMPLDQIRRLLQQTDSVVIIDEAYVDFGASSASSLIRDYENLLVIQTFSKSRSLAGLRLGYALGHADLINGLNRVKNSFNSYPIDRLSTAVAIASINDEAYFKLCCRHIIETRAWLSQALTNLDFEVLPSSSNFIFAQHTSHAAVDLYHELKQAGLLVRHFKSERINNFLRISIGSNEECRALVEALKTIL